MPINHIIFYALMIIAVTSPIWLIALRKVYSERHQTKRRKIILKEADTQ